MRGYLVGAGVTLGVLLVLQLVVSGISSTDDGRLAKQQLGAAELTQAASACKLSPVYRSQKSGDPFSGTYFGVAAADSQSNGFPAGAQVGYAGCNGVGWAGVTKLHKSSTGDWVWTQNSWEVGDLQRRDGYENLGSTFTAATFSGRNMQPVWRLWDTRKRVHLYTTNSEAKAQAKRAGANDEGVAFYLQRSDPSLKREQQCTWWLIPNSVCLRWE
jgi:hypothetical protein